MSISKTQKNHRLNGCSIDETQPNTTESLTKLGKSYLQERRRRHLRGHSIYNQGI